MQENPAHLSYAALNLVTPHTNKPHKPSKIDGL